MTSVGPIYETAIYGCRSLCERANDFSGIRIFLQRLQKNSGNQIIVGKAAMMHWGTKHLLDSCGDVTAWRIGIWFCCLENNSFAGVHMGKRT